MRNLSIAFVAALSLLSLAACKKGGGSSGGGGDYVAKLGEFRDRMCKCTDQACATKVGEDMAKWGAEVNKAGGPAKTSEADTKKIQEINDEFGKCMTKVASAAPPPAAPPADPAAAPPADPAAAPPAGDKPADPAAAPPAGDKPK